MYTKQNEITRMYILINLIKYCALMYDYRLIMYFLLYGKAYRTWLLFSRYLTSKQEPCTSVVNFLYLFQYFLTIYFICIWLITVLVKFNLRTETRYHTFEFILITNNPNRIYISISLTLCMCWVNRCFRYINISIR